MFKPYESKTLSCFEVFKNKEMKKKTYAKWYYQKIENEFGKSEHSLTILWELKLSDDFSNLVKAISRK